MSVRYRWYALVPYCTYISKIRLTETLSNLQYLISNGTRVHKYVTFIQINQHQLLLASLLTWRLGNYPASLLNLRCLIEQFKVQHTFFPLFWFPLFTYQYRYGSQWAQRSVDTNCWCHFCSGQCPNHPAITLQGRVKTLCIFKSCSDSASLPTTESWIICWWIYYTNRSCGSSSRPATKPLRIPVLLPRWKLKRGWT